MAGDSVSLRDIYEAVNSLEQKMTKSLDKIDERVNKLESFRDKTLGMVAILTSFISLAINFIWEKVVGKS